MSLPAADDLFRPTSDKPAVRAVPDSPEDAPADAPAKKSRATKAAPAPKGASGRIRHDEKMTVYVTADELLAIEQTRLRLRAEHGLAVDRGRLVREALHLVLEEFEAHGEDSALVRRLRA
ncbi:hypothetical protein HNR19_002190 [Nocardioides thalensis]|uniref:Cobyrinic acid a,c-diamide synthase n=1 Tax=Nocardioides thalensis TaxID=1914755 RepID=A0A853C473_9ACTN|nr:hypothetical protein [Nocardioides thalensis]